MAMQHVRSAYPESARLGRPSPCTSIATLTIALSLTAIGATAQDATDLGSLGGTDAHAIAINNAGAIVGKARGAVVDDERGEYHGFYKSPGGPLLNIDPEGVSSQPIGINAHGVVLARRDGREVGPDVPVYWTAAKGQTELSPPPDYEDVEAVDIDDAGNILLNAFGLDLGTQRAFLFDLASGRYTELRCPAANCLATAMNETGAVVGIGGESVYAHALLWPSSTSEPILLPDHARFKVLAPVDINDRGTIVGNGEWLDRQDSVAVWSGPRHVLRIVGDGKVSAINAHDTVSVTVKGHPDRDPFSEYAKLWDLSGDRELTLGGLASGDSEAAFDLNDDGVAVGAAFGERVRAIVWTARERGSFGSLPAIPQPVFGRLSGAP